ncbi:chemotaxis protein PomA [Clostridium homopropionicum DSM 5847]|uniref:Chemotaxis protein PomA n=1 Tax=Clostridium homopropionicum DSM 5847 TaxID=1121318 RepID=A0A0L6ZEU9_9CLOT|nr:flagellar motor protein [Clostridium homopropionicum]KOA21501.1 chemotaxis protein PomA [Clostridium homopropionicum DSM 5847]SFG07650.1 chemotaxis protein MotA [Clostridium homopropionicum]
MDISTVIFLIISFGGLILGFVLEGGHLAALLVGTAGLIVFGGTIGAVGVSFPMNKLKRVPGALKTTFSSKKSNRAYSINYFVDIAKKTRQNGLLSLESDLSDSNMDPFIKKGLQAVVDGVEPETVKTMLHLDAEMTSMRHKDTIAIFEAAGGFAPTMGIIGTVMGLVHVLGNLSDPGSLGPKIAVAFIATLYGVSSANLLWLPIASKLKVLNKDELIDKELVIEAISCIQAGINPNTIGEKLKGFMDKKELAEYESKRGENLE